VDAYGLVLDRAVVVEKALGLRAAVRPRPQLGSEAARRQRHEARHHLADRVAAVFLAQRREPLDAEPRTADLRAQITEHDLGDTAVVGDDRLDRLLDAGFGLEPHRRQQQPVVIDLARRRAGGARHQAADVGFVRQAHAEADQHALMEGGRHRDEVGRMRAAALVGIVGDEAFAPLESGRGIARKHGLHRLLVGGEMILQPAADDDHAAGGVGQAGGAVLRFTQDGGIAAVVERVFHGGGGLAQPARHHLGRDGIDGHGCSLASMTRVAVSSTVAIAPAGTKVVASN
jgi:hypothetical protein